MGFFRPNLLDCRKVKDLSLAEQLYLYERTRRFKDPPFGKQHKTAVGVYGKNIAPFFSIWLFGAGGSFFCKPPTLEQVFESERLHVFFLKLLANFQLRIETTFFSNRKFRVQKLHVVFFVQVGATRKLPPFSEASKT